MSLPVSFLFCGIFFAKGKKKRTIFWANFSLKIKYFNKLEGQW